ncbi:cytochrome P450 71B10-like [Actinidia eriantha]|uniref:cytochrome P450 71B10-like n=1 Tax=Actinidia eriantha TaxID=165200 RepID=UPI002584F6DC|nr:cytochrome P450 71B10-like [Actinidia eriantha]XP_057514151.1 cytochrome P450 71B10-like [Actinidia eriantha]
MPITAIATTLMGLLTLPLVSLPWLLTVILLLLPILYIFFSLLNQKKNSSKRPPSPRRLPIIGNLHQLGEIPHHSLWKLSHKYGPIMLLQLGRTPTLVVSTPDLAKEVLRTHDLDCCTRPLSRGQRKLSYNFLDLAFSPYGEYWREMRKLCVIELFTNKRVQSFWYVRESEVSHLISTISQASPNPIDLSDLMFSLSNNVIGKIAFGTSHRGNQFEYGKLKDIIDDAMTLLSGFSASDFFPSIGGLLDVVTGLQWKLERCFKNLDTFFEKVLEEHLDPARPKPQDEDITDVMLGLAKDRTTVIRLEKEHMKAVLLDIFLGAVDTSSVTMIWALAELVKNPRAMKKAQAEIRTHIGPKPMVPESELPNFKYLKLVVKETLRLHPPASLLIPHETIRDCKIGGYEIDAKTRVLVNAWAIGRDPKMWKEPEEFIPERFEGIGVDYKGQSFEFLPFGSGRRMCPGINMAIMSVEFTVANLLHCFDWKLPGGLKEEELNMEEEFGLNIRKKVPLKLVATKHNWAENK